MHFFEIFLLLFKFVSQFQRPYYFLVKQLDLFDKTFNFSGPATLRVTGETTISGVLNLEIYRENIFLKRLTQNVTLNKTVLTNFDINDFKSSSTYITVMGILNGTEKHLEYGKANFFVFILNFFRKFTLYKKNRKSNSTLSKYR